MPKQAPAARDATDAPGVKDRILRAAIEEFALTGYHLTSLRTISERSGSNKPMIYYHFHGKEGLYLACVRLLLEELAEALREVAAQDAPALLRLRRFAEAYLDAFLVSRPMMGTALRELNSLTTPLYQAITEEYSHLISPIARRILAEGVEQGEFRKLEIDGCVNGVANLLHGYVRFRRTAPEHLIRPALTQLMDYYAVGLLSHEALAEHLARQSAGVSD
jgi:AcrR family transcriptional regulator